MPDGPPTVGPQAGGPVLMQGGPHPSVTSVAAVMGLALLGDSLLYVVLPIHAAAFGVSFAWVGALLSANRLVRIFAYGAIAEVSRRIGARRLTIAAAIGATASTAAYGVCTGEEPLLAARIVWGLAFGALNLTMLAYAVRDAARAGRRVGVSRSISGLGPVLSLTLGAWLVGYVGPQGVFVALALVTASSIPLAWTLPELSERRDDRPRSLLPWPSRLDLWSFAVGFGIDGIFVMTLSVLLSGVVSLESAVLTSGLLLATRRLVEVLVAPVGGVLGDWWGAGRMLLLFGIALAAGLSAIAGGWVYAGAIVIVLAHGVLTTLGPVLVAERNRSNHMAPLSVFVTWRDFGAALGPLFAGLSIGYVSLPLLYASLAGLVLLPLLVDVRALISARPSAAVDV
jgi:DHA1 family inner membrane transport protein